MTIEEQWGQKCDIGWMCLTNQPAFSMPWFYFNLDTAIYRGAFMQATIIITNLKFICNQIPAQKHIHRI